MREVTKQVKHEVDGEEMTFQVRKMNALDGSYLMKFCAEKLMPIFSAMKDTFKPVGDDEDEEAVVQARTAEVLNMIPVALASLSRKDLAEFQTMCLNTVDALLPAGWQQIMDGNSFCVEEIEYDAGIALVLCYDVLEFNLGGFFGGKGLSSLLPQQSTQQ